PRREQFEANYSGKYVLFPSASALRQGDGDAGATANLAVELDRSAMQLDETLGQGQAEAGALEFPGERRIDLAERAEDLVEILASNTDPGVLDGEAEPPRLMGARLQQDRAAFRGEFEGVRQQVEHDLLQHPFIGPDYRQVLGDVERQ